MAVKRSYMVAGKGWINESKTSGAQYIIPGFGYINETFARFVNFFVKHAHGILG